jgi:hypothetical protein
MVQNKIRKEFMKHKKTISIVVLGALAAIAFGAVAFNQFCRHRTTIHNRHYSIKPGWVIGRGHEGSYIMKSGNAIIVDDLDGVSGSACSQSRPSRWSDYTQADNHTVVVPSTVTADGCLTGNGIDQHSLRMPWGQFDELRLPNKPRLCQHRPGCDGWISHRKRR